MKRIDLDIHLRQAGVMGFRYAHNASKYNSQKTIIDGIRFDSKAEAEYFLHLKALEKLGQLKVLEVQPKVYMTDARILYKPDFLIDENGKLVFIDVKGVQTAIFKMKARLFEHYGHGTLRLVQKNRFGFHTVKEYVAKASP